MDAPLEKEVKFYLSDLPAMTNRLLSLGAIQMMGRTHEVNYRFDTPDGVLAQKKSGLRLRRDARNILTFKGPSTTVDGVRVRPEYEVEVDNLQNAWLILERLGYEMVVSYEKWSAVYQLDGLAVTLDELPYGNFTEIEGADTNLIRSTAAALALDWDRRIDASYLGLFERLKEKMALSCRHLTFAEFAPLAITSEDLGVEPADAA